MRDPGKTPQFHVIPVVITGLMIYFLLFSFFTFFLAFNEAIIPLASEQEEFSLHAPKNPQLAIAAPGNRNAVIPFSDFLPLGGLIGLFAINFYHRPLIQYFRRLRKKQAISPALSTAARARLKFSAQVTGYFMPSVFFLLTFVLTLSQRGTGEPFKIWSTFLLDSVFIALSALFTYQFQKHRIQEHYLKHLYSEEELAAQLPPWKKETIKNNMFRIIMLSTGLPLLVVVLFLTSGISSINNAQSLSDEQLGLLFQGVDTQRWINTIGEANYAEFRANVLPTIPLIFYSVPNTYRLVIGLSLCIVIVLIYVFFMVRWNVREFVHPLLDLGKAMKRVESGELAASLQANTTNEMGEITIGFNKMISGLAEREKIKGLFGRYLTREISDAILDGRVNMKGDRYDVTVMFTDIRDFTSLSEQLAPEEVFSFLNEYLEAMIDVLVAEGGIIDKFLGDGILAVFGIPVPSKDHAQKAFNASRAMHQKLKELNETRKARGEAPIEIGIGLHSGQVIAGNVGSERKMQYTVIGDTVNVASRIEGMNKTLGSTLLLSEATWDRLESQTRASFGFTRLEGIELKGKKEKLTLYKAEAFQ